MSLNNIHSELEFNDYKTEIQKLKKDLMTEKQKTINFPLELMAVKNENKILKMELESEIKKTKHIYSDKKDKFGM